MINISNLFPEKTIIIIYKRTVIRHLRGIFNNLPTKDIKGVKYHSLKVPDHIPEQQVEKYISEKWKL